MSDTETIRETHNKLNKFLSNTRKTVRHLFRYVDREEFFSPINNSHNSCIRLYTSQTKYVLYTNDTDYYPNYNVHYVKRDSDILVGLYFPHHNIGDEIRVDIGGCYISTITITDTNKIYLPIDDEHFILLIALVYHTVKLYSNRQVPIYAVNMNLQREERMDLARFFGQAYLLSNTNQGDNMYLSHEWGQCIIRYDKEMVYVYDYYNDKTDYAITIQRAWKRYKQRQQEQSYQKWLDNIEKVNTEIRVLPDIGIEYFRAMNEFNFYSKDI